MRIWDQIPPNKLCRNHLLAEHRETLAIWSILTNDKKGYRNHPEVKRWEGKLWHLTLRHARLWGEAQKRYNHRWKILPNWQLYVDIYSNAPDPWDDQIATLKSKGCECKV